MNLTKLGRRAMAALGIVALAAADAVVVDRSVATVQGRVVTLSELEFETRVALVQRGGTEAAEKALGDEVLRDGLEWSIAERLATEEADKLQVLAADEREVAAAMESFRQRFASPQAYEAFLRRYEASESQLSALLSRSIRAARALEAKVRFRSRVGDAEVREAYRKQSAALGGRPLEEVRAGIEQKLTQEKRNQLLSEEVKKLRERADVRWLAPFPRSNGR